MCSCMCGFHAASLKDCASIESFWMFLLYIFHTESSFLFLSADGSLQQEALNVYTEVKEPLSEMVYP